MTSKASKLKSKNRKKKDAKAAALPQIFSGPEPTDQVSLVSTPKEAFWNWLSKNSDHDLVKDLKENDGGRTCILIHDYGDSDLLNEYIDSRIALLAEALFGPWVTDPQLWPKFKSLGDLKNFFDFSFTPVVIELEPMNVDFDEQFESILVG